MKIFLTFDYELFFGEDSGTVEKCMIEPTNDLLELSKGKEVYYTFFVDVGYFIQAEKYPELKNELELVQNQIKEIISLGHDVQLHIHPHWEKSEYKNGKWQMNTTDAYKLSDFDQEDSNAIVRKYKEYLETLIGRKVEAYRAGGWCIQPFIHVQSVFKETGIKLDSSVIAGDYMMTSNYAIDFRNAPSKSKYRFEDDVCIENENGAFVEYPIASLRYSPMFFWRLYILGRLAPSKHKMIGDGSFISQGGRKKRVLRTFTIGHVSSDGYFASKLDAALDKAKNMAQEEMVVIGHPKGNTQFSVKALKNFIEVHHKNHSFTSFHKVL